MPARDIIKCTARKGIRLLCMVPAPVFDTACSASVAFMELSYDTWLPEVSLLFGAAEALSVAEEATN